MNNSQGRKPYGTFGVYCLHYNFFQDMKSEDILMFWKNFGWNKGYLLCPLPDKDTFIHRITQKMSLENPPFDIVLARELFEKISIDNDCITDKIKCYTEDNSLIYSSVEEPEIFFSKIQMHKMIWDDLLQLLTPWFQKGRTFVFVDPYFDPKESRWYEPLNKILEIAENRTEKTDFIVRYHNILIPKEGKTDDETLEDTLKNCENLKIKGKAHCDFTLYIWKKWKARHDRYLIIDDEIVISFSHGFDEAKACYASIAFHHSSDLCKIKEFYNPDECLVKIIDYSPQTNAWYPFLPEKPFPNNDNNVKKFIDRNRKKVN